ncbi:SCO family protein [Neorhizobium sp. BETTINA12A]|uniref:SCO family protein n=1 Tax=Neorhizobium sp. BETTINA12A TaxID=2908924 RepID=UPI0038D471B8
MISHIAMHAYITAFTESITSTTGSTAEMRKVIDGWMVRAAKQPSEDGDCHISHTMSLSPYRRGWQPKRPAALRIGPSLSAKSAACLSDLKGIYRQTFRRIKFREFLTSSSAATNSRTSLAFCMSGRNRR